MCLYKQNIYQVSQQFHLQFFLIVVDGAAGRCGRAEGKKFRNTTGEVCIVVIHCRPCVVQLMEPLGDVEEQKVKSFVMPQEKSV
jgi:hypothetical protein